MDSHAAELFTVEIWDDENDEYLRTAVIQRNGSVVEYAETAERGSGDTLQRRVQFSVVPPEEIYPPVSDELRVFSSPLSEHRYVKRPAISTYGHARGITSVADDFLHEIKVYERLSEHGHPHLAQYYGCIVEAGHIVGVVLERYVATLGDLIRQSGILEHSTRSQCFTDIEAAIRFLHGLGLAHNDVNPQNIMLDKNNAFVLIDLDSCTEDGAPMAKAGTMEWNDWFEEHSAFSNDNLALEKLRSYLEL